jgi:glycosyltransferase involved in cell wall biosynthesis
VTDETVDELSEPAELPDVDVIIATRDRPALMRASVECVLDQYYRGPINVLLIYDQSEPQMGVAHSFRLDNRSGPRTLRVYSNDRTPGLAGARNTGLVQATAELVAFCDDDDTWLPDKLDWQVQALTDDPQAEFVCCGIEVQYNDRPHPRTLKKTKVTLHELLRDRMTELHPSTFVMRRKAVLDGFGLVQEQIPGSYAEDYEFLIRAARQHPISNVEKVGVRVLWSTGSFFAERWSTIELALTWLLDEYPEFTEVPAGRARITGQIAFASAANGEHRQSWRWIATTLRTHPTEARTYLAALVNLRLIRPESVVRLLHRYGRGL